MISTKFVELIFKSVKRKYPKVEFRIKETTTYSIDIGKGQVWQRDEWSEFAIRNCTLKDFYTYLMSTAKRINECG